MLLVGDQRIGMIAPLTDKYIKVLVLASVGGQDKVIAWRYGITKDGIVKRWRHIRHVLGATDRTHTVAIAVGMGLIPIPAPARRPIDDDCS